MNNRPRSSVSAKQPAMLAHLLLVALALMAGLMMVGRRVQAAPGADWTRLLVSRATGDALSQPTAYKADTTAGPWTLTVTDVTLGDDANRIVTNASDFNQSPPDGLSYVAVKIRAQNNGSVTEHIDGDDFAIADSSGIIRRFSGAIPPKPGLAGDVAPGDALEGYVVGAATSGDRALVLVFDPTTLTGNWADATLALARDAAIPAATSRTVKANKIGREAGNPAGLNTRVATRDWAVEVTQVVSGTDVIALYPESDYRTTALLGAGQDVAATWIAFKVTVTNNGTGDQPAYFPVTAFRLADGDGNPVPDLSILTPPDPDAAGYYAPGASREGWVVFDAAKYDGALLRFQPFRTDDDPRFIAYDGSGDTNAGPSFSGTLANGAKVKTTEDGVRLRKAPSTGADIVAELPAGTELTVTGEPQTAEGITWYPVKTADGKTGYIAEQFIDRE